LELTRTQRIVLGSSLALVCLTLAVTTVARRNRGAVVVTDTQALPTPGVQQAAAGPQVVTVHVVGAVRQPGLVQLAPGSRIWDAVTAAGGFTDSANTQALNLAAAVPDGVQICVPTLRAPLPSQAGPMSGSGLGTEAPAATPDAYAPTPAEAGAPAPGYTPSWQGQSAPADSGAEGQPPAAQPSAGYDTPARQPATAIAAAPPSGVHFPVSVNRADASELEALPGVGPALAERIVRYRSTNGPFQRVEDLDNVRGIGPATLAKIAPYITP
jgi:competence protein ComEA